MTTPSESLLGGASPPAYMTAFDGGDWSHYVHTHDPDELWQIDDPAELDFERLWMRPIKASQCDDFGVYDEDQETVERDPETGRFKARVCWIECAETANGAAPFMGARYKP